MIFPQHPNHGKWRLCVWIKWTVFHKCPSLLPSSTFPLWELVDWCTVWYCLVGEEGLKQVQPTGAQSSWRSWSWPQEQKSPKATKVPLLFDMAVSSVHTRVASGGTPRWQQMVVVQRHAELHFAISFELWPFGWFASTILGELNDSHVWQQGVGEYNKRFKIRWFTWPFVGGNAA